MVRHALLVLLPGLLACSEGEDFAKDGAGSDAGSDAGADAGADADAGPDVNPPNGTWELADDMYAALQEHKTALLGDGRVLLAGGTGPAGVTDRAEVFDLKTGSWTRTEDMLVARSEHKLVTLGDGRVLAIGGSSMPSGAEPLVESEIYDRDTGAWEAVGDLNEARVYASAVSLLDGRAMVCGGVSGCEVFDPGAGEWTEVSGSAAVAARAEIAVLEGGRVLCVMADRTRIYDPDADEWEDAAPLGTARFLPELVRLDDGSVLAIGGTTGSDYFATCELFDPSDGEWTPTGDLATPRTLAFAGLLPGGWVLVAGGRTDWSGPAPESTDSTEVYDPATGEWFEAAPLNSPTQESPGVVFPTGEVMVCGGWSGSWPLDTTEVYTEAD